MKRSAEQAAWRRGRERQAAEGLLLARGACDELRCAGEFCGTRMELIEQKLVELAALIGTHAAARYVEEGGAL